MARLSGSSGSRGLLVVAQPESSSNNASPDSSGARRRAMSLDIVVGCAGKFNIFHYNNDFPLKPMAANGAIRHLLRCIEASTGCRSGRRHALY
jgi:hypothetical protein